jgi:hypothetical protein
MQTNRQHRRAGDRMLARSRALIRAAAESLGFDDQRVAAAQNGYGEDADILSARVLEMLELENGFTSSECVRARAEMEQRHGAGFVARVAAMGRPAATALKALRALLLLVLLLIWPSAAAAQNARESGVRNAHKIQRRNRQKFARFLRKAYHFRSWTRLKRSFGPSGRRFSSRLVSGTGCGRGHVRCDSWGLTSRSSWFGAAGASASATSRAMTRISRWNCPTARSSARLSSRHLAL